MQQLGRRRSAHMLSNIWFPRCEKRARNKLAIRTLFLGASEDTDSLGLQLQAVWCQGGSVLSHVCRTPAPFGVFPREAASASRRSWRALAEATVGTQRLSWQTNGQQREGCIEMETRMLGLAWLVGSFVACVVRRAWSVLSLDTTQVHQAPSFRTSEHTGGLERQSDEPSPRCFLGRAALAEWSEK